MLQQTDPQIYQAIQRELQREREGLVMIPSENFASLAVLEACGSILNNKYSEGYPGKRYYTGNENADRVEDLARERAKKIFGFNHANVQPYSGSPANLAVYFALLEPGEKVMGMNLLWGGHLTHGWPVNFSGRIYQSVQYTTNPEGFLNYDELEKMAKKERPKIIFCGATGYPRLYNYQKFAEIAHSINAYFIADIAHEAGLIAAGVIPGPSGQADVVTMTTHKTLRGPRGAIMLCNGKPSTPLKQVEKTRENLPTLIDRAIFPGLQGGPHDHTTAGIAVALKEAMRPEFKIYAQNILNNARSLAQGLMTNGLKLVTNGTENHLMLIDLRDLKINGQQAANTLAEVGIYVNANTIPHDPNPPFKPSGIRLGTPALTTRGFTPEDMIIIAQLLAKILPDPENEKIKNEVKNTVKELTQKYPLYPELDMV
jgi:glycine hydroxymethyltransferase